MRVRHWLAILTILGIIAPVSPLAATARQASTVTPESAAVFYSQLEASGAFETLYDWMHPDAQGIVPAAAVVGWYANEFAPNGPGVITVTGVEMTSWTWEVTGTTYPNTAVVSFQQPFANGTVVEDVMRLVESDGEWRWFFGRSREFVDAQIAAYGDLPIVSGESCDGAAAWWAETYPRTIPAYYLDYAFPVVWNGGNTSAALLEDSADGFRALYDAQARSLAPPAAATLQAELLSVFEDFERGMANLAAVASGSLNPVAESGALSAGVQQIDSGRSTLLSLQVTIDDFLAQCAPVVVFVFGMGEDPPVGVRPGQVGPGVPVVACANFEDRSQAQRFFDAAQPGDPHRLDPDRNGRACD